jgi:arylsulfatase A-like enzyme
VRVGRWKYIESKSEVTSELYDLESDPRELSDLHDARPEEAARLAATLATWVAEILQTHCAGASEEDAKGLGALEYVQ